MPFQSALPVAETQLGIAIETTRGTPVNPAYWVPLMGPKYVPDLKFLPDNSLRGSMVETYDEVPSLRMDTHGWDSYPYLDSFGIFLRAILGSADTVTAAPSSTTLHSSASAGATTISTAATIAANSWIVIDSGVGVQETHYTTAVSGTTTPYTVTLAYPLVFAHSSSATVTGLTQHQFSLLNNSASSGNQPPSCTLTDYSGETNWRQLAAAQLDTLNISGAADSLPKVTTAWMSNAAITPSTPTASYSTAEAPPGWTATLAIGGTQVAGGGSGGASTGVLVSYEWDFKRNVKPIAAITGTQAYFQFFAGPIVPSGKITVLDDSSATWLDVYESGATESIDFTLSDVKSGYALNLHTTTAKFLKGSIDRSKEWVEVPLELIQLPSSNDALAGGVSPVIATVANAQTASY